MVAVAPGVVAVAQVEAVEESRPAARHGAKAAASGRAARCRGGGAGQEAWRREVSCAQCRGDSGGGGSGREAAEESRAVQWWWRRRGSSGSGGGGLGREARGGGHGAGIVIVQWLESAYRALSTCRGSGWALGEEK